MWSAAKQAVVVFLISLPPAVVTAVWFPPQLPAAVCWLAPAEVAKISPADLLWVDARPASAYEAGHLPGAVLLNEDDWLGGLARFFEVWQPGLRVVVYCDSAGCDASAEVARKLAVEIDPEPVGALRGGYEEWAKLMTAQ